MDYGAKNKVVLKQTGPVLGGSRDEEAVSVLRYFEGV